MWSVPYWRVGKANWKRSVKDAVGRTNVAECRTLADTGRKKDIHLLSLGTTSNTKIEKLRIKTSSVVFNPQEIRETNLKNALRSKYKFRNEAKRVRALQ